MSPNATTHVQDGAQVLRVKKKDEKSASQHRWDAIRLKIYPLYCWTLSLVVVASRHRRRGGGL